MVPERPLFEVGLSVHSLDRLGECPLDTMGDERLLLVLPGAVELYTLGILIFTILNSFLLLWSILSLRSSCRETEANRMVQVV